MKTHIDFYLAHLRQDFSSSIVVFLVALPLCLGIALASGAPLFSGILSGLIGGIIVSWASGSQLSVSGPAAGLTVIVFNGIESLGNFEGFLLSVLIAGLLQILFGYFKAGVIGAFFPASVIKGMLAAIGLILIIKQTPHATGFDSSYDGDESYMQESAGSSFFELFDALEAINPAISLVSLISITILLLWETDFIKEHKYLKLIPGPLLAVIWGVGYNQIALHYFPSWAIGLQHLVNLPELGSSTAFFLQLSLPDFSYLANPKTYSIAITIAVIASLETLLSIEAVDKLDPQKRTTPTNRELKAQGLGNIISGLIGGLPITAVIVRSSANINAGGKTRLACFGHGLLLLVSVLFFSQYLNKIPLACLAAILLMTGYKLANPRLLIDYYRKGWTQFSPFAITILAILLTDLLQGIAIGMACGFFFVLKTNYHQAISLIEHNQSIYLLRLHKDVSFLNKALLREKLNSVPNDCELIIDGVRAQFIDHDILETLADFMLNAVDRNIKIDIQGLELKSIQN